MSRDKGRRVEQALVALHRDLGFHSEQVPLSGTMHYRGNGTDIDIYPFGRKAAPLVGKVTARASGEGFATLERWFGKNDVLFLRRDRAEPMVVLPWRSWARLLATLAGKAIPLPQIGVPTAGQTTTRGEDETSPLRPSRAVVADDSERVVLTLYHGRDALGAAVLGPVRVIGLAGALIEAAHLRLSRAQSGISQSSRDGD